jgi:hypothetical protein
MFYLKGSVQHATMKMGNAAVNRKFLFLFYLQPSIVVMSYYHHMQLYIENMQSDQNKTEPKL